MANYVSGILGISQNIVSFIVIFGVLVFIHELGHFLVAKWSGVRVHEFALGFGPTFLRKQVGETLYALRIIPLGGFVRLAGMEPTDPMSEEEIPETENDDRAFHRRPVGHRLAILAAGPIMNLLLAALIYSIVLSGLVVSVGNVVPGSPAEHYGLQAEDRLVSVGGRRVLTVQQVLEGIQESNGSPVTVVVDRQGKREVFNVQPEIDSATGIPVIGIELRMDTGTARRPLGESIVVGVQQTATSVKELVLTLGRMITGTVAPELAGPIGIFQMAGESAQGGSMTILLFMAVLSISLGVFNLLPIPVLDGGGILFVLIEGIRGRPLNPEFRGIAQLVGLSLLFLLLIYATMQDIRRLIPNDDSQTSLHGESAYEIRLSEADLQKDGGLLWKHG